LWGATTWLKEFFSKFVIIRPFLRVTKNLIGIWNFLENLFSFFLVVHIFIWMVLQWKLFIGFLNLCQICIFWNS
jgi:hypothetical protein